MPSQFNNPPPPSSSSNSNFSRFSLGLPYFNYSKNVTSGSLQNNAESADKKFFIKIYAQSSARQKKNEFFVFVIMFTVFALFFCASSTLIICFPAQTLFVALAGKVEHQKREKG